MFSDLVANNKHLSLLCIVLGHELRHFEPKLLLELPELSLLLAVPGPAGSGLLLPFLERRPGILSHVAHLLALQILAILLEQIGVVELVVARLSLCDSSLDLVARGRDREQEHDREDVDGRVHDLLEPRVSQEDVGVLLERQQVLVDQTTGEYLHYLLQLAVVVPFTVHADRRLFLSRRRPGIVATIKGLVPFFDRLRVLIRPNERNANEQVEEHVEEGVLAEGQEVLLQDLDLLE